MKILFTRTEKNNKYELCLLDILEYMDIINDNKWIRERITATFEES